MEKFVFLFEVGVPAPDLRVGFKEGFIMKQISTCFCCLLLLFAVFVPMTGTLQQAWAQEVTASITGTVNDPSGAAITGATVTATSQERGAAYTATTNESGL
jgi:hypothetical protein